MSGRRLLKCAKLCYIFFLEIRHFGGHKLSLPDDIRIPVPYLRFIQGGRKILPVMPYCASTGRAFWRTVCMIGRGVAARVLEIHASSPHTAAGLLCTGKVSGSVLLHIALLPRASSTRFSRVEGLGNLVSSLKISAWEGPSPI